MKTKLIVFIIIILILSGCNSNQKDNTNIKITLPPEIAKTATSATYETYPSNKKDKIAYIRPEGVYVYTLTTKENKFLISSASINSETDVNIGNWSPDDKYIVCDTGSYIERGKIVVDSQTNKVIAQFDTLDIYAWISPEEIVFTDLQSISPRPYAGAGHGIAIINLNTGEKTILKRSTKTENYTFIKLTKENNILFYKTLYQPIKPEEFKYGKEESTNWIMDKDGKNEKQVEYKNNKWQPIK